MANKPFGNIDFSKIAKATQAIPGLGGISQVAKAVNTVTNTTKPVVKAVQAMKPAQQQELSQKVNKAAAQEKYTSIIQEAPLSEKEVNFLKQAKALGFDQNKAMEKIQQKRLETQDLNPAIQGNTVKNVGEGLVDYAGGLPKALAESKLLDKPVAAITRGTRNVAELLGANVKSKEEVDKRLDANKFSEYAAGSQVGGDQNSNTAKTISNVMNKAELVAGGAALLGGGIKQVGKAVAKKQAKKIAVAQEAGELTAKQLGKKGNKILQSIADEGVNAQRIAIEDGRLVDNARSPLKEFLFGTSKAKIEPSQRAIDSVGTIIRQIPNASKKPITLFNQIEDKVESLSKNLGTKLKSVDVSTLDDDKLGTFQKLDEFISEPGVKEIYGNANIKKVKSLMDKILNANNADEIWQARKEFDIITPKSIKNISNISDSKAQAVNAFWREARSHVNDLLDNVAENATDIGVKQELKTLSNLYHGQNQILKNLGRIAKNKKGLFNKENIKAAAGISAAGWFADKIKNMGD